MKVYAQFLETEVEEIEVIAEEVSTGLIDAPVKVEVLGKDYLQEQQYQDLSEGISDIPGVMSVGNERKAGSKSAMIQGFGENSVLVMIDGVPVSQNSSFGFDLSQIATSDIEKVEVIKGGASSLYGSQAMGGVINIVTKRLNYKDTIEVEASGGELSSGGSGRNRNIKAHLEKALGAKSSIKGTYSFRDGQAFDLDPSTLIKDGADWQRQQGTLELETKLGRSRFFVNGIYLKGFTDSVTSRPFSSSSFGPSQNVTDTTTLNVKAGLERKMENGTLRAIVNYEKNQDDLKLNDNPMTSFTETLKENSFAGRRVDLQYKNLKIGTHSLTAGALYRDNLVNQVTTNQATEEIIVRTSDVKNKEVTSYEVFVQDNFWLGNVEASPGLRYQYDKDFGSYVSPKINLSHYTDFEGYGLKSWVTVGTGYRAPSVKERFFTLDHSSVANYVVIGNQNLNPESSLSFQVGEEIKFKGINSASFYGNFFLNQISDLIETVEAEGDGSNTVYSYRNFDKVISRGIELGLKANLTNKLSLMLNGSYTETINRESNLLLLNRPLYMGLFSLKYKVSPKLNFISLTKFTGASYTDVENENVSPTFVKMDIKANYQYDRKVSGFLSLRNIFNEIREPGADTVVPIVDNRPARGREIFLGINLRVL